MESDMIVEKRNSRSSVTILGKRRKKKRRLIQIFCQRILTHECMFYWAGRRRGKQNQKKSKKAKKGFIKPLNFDEKELKQAVLMRWIYQSIIKPPQSNQSTRRERKREKFLFIRPAHWHPRGCCCWVGR